MKIVSCKKCGARVSDQYSYCTNCQAPLDAEAIPSPIERIDARTQIVIEPTQAAEELKNTRKAFDVEKRVGKASNSSRLQSYFGEMNSDEKYFLYAFILSILLGLVYGLFDKSLALIVDTQFHTIKYDTPISIFSHNFLLVIVSAVTGGIGILVVNFLTYAVLSGLIGLAASHSLNFTPNQPTPSFGILLIALVGTVMVALLELTANFCFSISGFSVLEMAWKRKTKLRRVRLLLMGTTLLFIGAMLEWTLEVLMR